MKKEFNERAASSRPTLRKTCQVINAVVTVILDMDRLVEVIQTPIYHTFENQLLEDEKYHEEKWIDDYNK